MIVEIITKKNILYWAGYNGVYCIMCIAYMDSTCSSTGMWFC